MSGKIMGWKTTSKNSIRLLWVGYITSNNSIFNSFMICLNGLKVNNLFYNLTAQVCVAINVSKNCVFPFKLYRKYIIIAGLNRLCISYLSWIIHSLKPTQSPPYDIQMEFAFWYILILKVEDVGRRCITTEDEFHQVAYNCLLRQSCENEWMDIGFRGGLCWFKGKRIHQVHNIWDMGE